MKAARIYLAGESGMVGSAFLRRLAAQSAVELFTRSHAELDLTDQAAVRAFMALERPATVNLAAARSAGSTPTTPIRPSSSTRT